MNSYEGLHFLLAFLFISGFISAQTFGWSMETYHQNGEEVTDVEIPLNLIRIGLFRLLERSKFSDNSFYRCWRRTLFLDRGKYIETLDFLP